jgi:hypothetical protein
VATGLKIQREPLDRWPREGEVGIHKALQLAWIEAFRGAALAGQRRGDLELSLLQSLQLIVEAQPQGVDHQALEISGGARQARRPTAPELG